MLQTLFTTCRMHCQNGVFLGKKEDGVLAFLGVPYAQKPTGPLRFKKARAQTPSTDLFVAQEFGPIPLQKQSESKDNTLPASEDCLRLNIWIGEGSNEKRPILVFFHGGYFRVGGTAMPMYNGKNVAQAHPECIIITVGSRLGIMGFLDLRSVPGGEDFPDCNLGLYDMCAALRWIKGNAQAFLGDPCAITLFGSSSGAASVSLLTLMEEARGLFSRVIIASGSLMMTGRPSEYALLTKELLETTGAKTTDDLLRISESDMAEIVRVLHRQACFPLRGDGIPVQPLQALSRGAARGIDFLIGSALNEFGFWIPEAGGREPFYTRIVPGFFLIAQSALAGFEKDIDAYLLEIAEKEGDDEAKLAFLNDLIFHAPEAIEARAQSPFANVYRYRMTWKVPKEDLGSCHLVETVLFFGNHSERLFGDAPLPEKMIATIRNVWLSFALQGKPCEGWPSLSSCEDRIMLLDQNLTLTNDPLAQRLTYMTPIMEQTEENGLFRAFVP